MTSTPQRTIVDNNGLSRAEQRKQRLMEAESELAMEEAEALKLTEEQREILLRPFAAVKAEFSDLDGQRWTQSALRMFQPSHWRSAQSVAAPVHAASLSRNPFLFLATSDSRLFSADDTIRATSPKSTSFKTTTQSFQVPCRHRDGTRSRSPIKGLFNSRSPLAESSTAVQFTVLEADITDASDDSGAEEDAVYISRFSVASRNARLHASGPPGLTPPNTTTIPPSPTPKSKNRSFNFMSAKDFPDTLKTNPSLSVSNHQDASCPVAPLPHRNAPSPPSQPLCAVVTIPSISISAPSAGPDALTLRASRTPATIVPSTIKSKHNQPRSTARTRLHSLLKDVRHGRISASVPTSPILRPTASHPPPLELSGSPESRDLTDLDLFTEEDDETPRPSPIAERYCKIPTVPRVRSHNC